MVYGLGLEEGEELRPSGAAGTGGDQAEHHMDGERGEDEVGALGVGEKSLGKGQSDVGLGANPFSHVHGSVFPSALSNRPNENDRFQFPSRHFYKEFSLIAYF